MVVPFSLPGEKIRARIYRNARLHSFADFLSVKEKNPSLRNMDLVKCRYFGSCAGCQYQVKNTLTHGQRASLNLFPQMIPYEKQLIVKRDVVSRAYSAFSGMDTFMLLFILN